MAATPLDPLTRLLAITVCPVCAQQGSWVRRPDQRTVECPDCGVEFSDLDIVRWGPQQLDEALLSRPGPVS